MAGDGGESDYYGIELELWLEEYEVLKQLGFYHDDEEENDDNASST